MTRAPGRRVAPRVSTHPVGDESRERPWRAVVAVLLTAGVLLLAALGPVAALHRSGADTTRTASLARDLTCFGGLPGARMRAALLGGSDPGALRVGGRPVVRTDRPLPGGAVDVHAARSRAADAYAVQWASGRGWLAAAACPAPRADWWFLGVGAGSRHTGVLELHNPRPGEALVDVSVLGPRGPVAAPGLRGIRVSSGRTVRLDLSKVAAAYGDLALHVAATRGLVAASVSERWARDLVARPVRDWVGDLPGPARAAGVLGLPHGATAARLLVANPSSREAVVTVRLVGRHGTFAPTGTASVQVPPESLASVDLGDALRADAQGVRLRSQVPVVGTVRSTVGLDESRALAAPPFGRAGVVGVPPGSPATLVLAGPRSGSAQVSVEGYDARGRSLGTRNVAVPARSAVTVAVWAGAAALRLSADAAVGGVVLLGGPARPVSAVVAVPSASSEARVPHVRATW